MISYEMVGTGKHFKKRGAWVMLLLRMDIANSMRAGTRLLLAILFPVHTEMPDFRPEIIACFLNEMNE